MGNIMTRPGDLVEIPLSNRFNYAADFFTFTNSVLIFAHFTEPVMLRVFLARIIPWFDWWIFSHSLLCAISCNWFTLQIWRLHQLQSHLFHHDICSLVHSTCFPNALHIRLCIQVFIFISELAIKGLLAT